MHAQPVFPWPSPPAEVRRLLAEIDTFDRDIASVEARLAASPSAVDRVFLSGLRGARHTTQQALDVWLIRLACRAVESRLN